MTELFEKSIRVLELPQLLERLSQKAVSEAAKERALRLTPSTDADDVRRLQDETDAARALIGLRGSPSFSGVKDVREALARAERGGMLNPRELLTIAGLLTNSRRVREYYEADQGEGTVLDRMFDSLHANRFLEDKITTSILSEDEIADAASPELADIRRHKRQGQTDLAEDHLLAQLQEHAAGGAYHPARRALRRARQGRPPRRPARPCSRHFHLGRDALC
mgnify:CR=1 FL=1